MEPASTPAPAVHGSATSKPLFARRNREPASDEQLLARVRSGSDPAFAELYDRHFQGILAFCRHMLGSRDEAEDAVQQTFVSAYRDMLRHDHGLRLGPWLYQIARNHCIDALRKRRPATELSDSEPERSTAGLPEEVARRAELRELLADLSRLPLEQREALLLVELNGSSHREVASILDCDAEKVKSLVFQGRQRLLRGREARELTCRDVREQISVLRGPALRRGAIGHHVRGCEGCTAFEHEVKMQRRQLAVLLLVTPSAGLKLGAGTAMAAAGKAGGSVHNGAPGASSGGGAASGGASGVGAGSSAAATGGAAGAGSVGAAATTLISVGGAVLGAAAKIGLPAAVVKAAATTAAVGALAIGGVVGAHELVAATGGPVGPDQAPAAAQKPASDQAPAGSGAADSGPQPPVASPNGNPASEPRRGSPDSPEGPAPGADRHPGGGQSTPVKEPAGPGGATELHGGQRAGTTDGAPNGADGGGGPAPADSPAAGDPRSTAPKLGKSPSRGRHRGSVRKHPSLRPQPAPKPTPVADPPRGPGGESPSDDGSADPAHGKPAKPDPPGHLKPPKEPHGKPDKQAVNLP